jgi:hypothetical protein
MTLTLNDLIVDAELVFYDKDKNHYFELEYEGCIKDGFTEQPKTIFVKKGKRIYKKDL